MSASAASSTAATSGSGFASAFGAAFGLPNPFGAGLVSATTSASSTSSLATDTEGFVLPLGSAAGGANTSDSERSPVIARVSSVSVRLLTTSMSASSRNPPKLNCNLGNDASGSNDSVVRIASGGNPRCASCLLYTPSPFRAAGVTTSRYTGPSTLSAATTAMRFWSEQAFSFVPLGAILEPHAL